MPTSNEWPEKTLGDQETLAEEVEVAVEGVAMQVEEAEHHHPQAEPLEGMVAEISSSDSPLMYSQGIKPRQRSSSHSGNCITTSTICLMSWEYLTPNACSS